MPIGNKKFGQQLRNHCQVIIVLKLKNEGFGTERIMNAGKRIRRLISLLMLMLFAGGCTLPGSTQMLSEPDWKISEYGNADSPIPAVPNVSTSIKFGQDGKLSGSAGCNLFSGVFKISGNQIVFGEMVSTLMACEGPIMQQEIAVLNILTGNCSYTLEQGLLTIRTSKNSMLILAPQDKP